MASSEEIAGECRGGWCVRRWLVWVASLPAAPLIRFFCFSFYMSDGVRLSPAVPTRQIRGYLNKQKKRLHSSNQNRYLRPQFAPAGPLLVSQLFKALVLFLVTDPMWGSEYF